MLLRREDDAMDDNAKEGRGKKRCKQRFMTKSSQSYGQRQKTIYRFRFLFLSAVEAETAARADCTSLVTERSMAFLTGTPI